MMMTRRSPRVSSRAADDDELQLHTHIHPLESTDYNANNALSSGERRSCAVSSRRCMEQSDEALVAVVTRLCGEPAQCQQMDTFTAAALGLDTSVCPPPHHGSSKQSLLITASSSHLPPSQCEMEEETREGWSRIMYAIHYGRKETIKRLGDEMQPRRRVDLQPGRPRPSTTPLCLAVLSADCATVQLLCQNGEQTEQRDRQGRTPLHLAVKTNQPALAQVLLTCGASANTIRSEGVSSVTEAARLGHWSLVELLLSHRAAPPSSTLGLALDSGNLRSAQLILNHMKDNHSLQELFTEIKLEKYWHIFQRRNTSFSQLIDMTESHLKHLGLNLLGPRKKLVCVISLLRGERQDRSASS